MKYFVYLLDVLIIILIPVSFIIMPVKEAKKESIETDVVVKYLSSEEFIDIDSDEEIQESVKEESSTENTEKKEVLVEVKEEQTKVEIKEETKEEIVENKSDVLETQVGKMSGYGPDCSGCSGYLSSGKYVGDGDIYYNDSTYGKLRIVAGDKKYKLGTVIRVKNSKAGNFLAIVLDRGGSIGFGKKFLFDLLYTSEKEALKDEVSYNVTFEVLRYGY